MPKSQKKSQPSNKSIYDYLDYYCDPDREFRYAVMIRGPWGSGKTYLINQYLDSRAERKLQKNLYVSLYGLTSVRQIDHALYRQLHPILSSKGMKLAYDVTRAVVKVATKFDIDGDGGDDVTVTSNIPNVQLDEYFKTPSECLLVFDDLERCSMLVSDVMGYINAFVEHEGFKAIVIANEDEILKRNLNPTHEDANYETIKEKLIGQTLTLQSSVEAALGTFIDLVSHKPSKRYLKRHEADIKLLHNQSNTDNLRLLNHALLDFERIARCFRKRHWSEGEAIDTIFRTLVALSYEVRSGELKAEDFSDISRGGWLRQEPKDGSTSPYKRLSTRYPESDFNQTLITSNILKALLLDGHVDEAEVRTSLDNHPTFATAPLPPWKVAWHAWDIEDDELESAVVAMEADFVARAYFDPETFFQVFGIRLWLSSAGVLPVLRSDVTHQCMVYIDDLKSQGHFPDPILSRRPDLSFGSHGLGFHEHQSSDFATIVAHYDSVAKDALTESLPEKGRELLTLLQSDSGEFFRRMCINNVSSAPFSDIPVLAHIPAPDFVDVVLSLSQPSQRTAFLTFKERYAHGRIDGTLNDEKAWLVAFKTELQKRMTSMRPFSKHRCAERIKFNVDIFL